MSKEKEGHVNGGFAGDKNESEESLASPAWPARLRGVRRRVEVALCLNVINIILVVVAVVILAYLGWRKEMGGESSGTTGARTTPTAPGTPAASPTPTTSTAKPWMGVAFEPNAKIYDKGEFCVPEKVIPVCNVSHPYRTIDGSCNNFKYPLWGASDAPLLRLRTARYADNKKEPLGWNHEMKKYPTARELSVNLLKTKGIRLDETMTHMVMTFGQFLSHDTDLTRHLAQRPGMMNFPEKACKSGCLKRFPCFPIALEASDPRSISGQKCVHFVRSIVQCGGDDAPLQQVNEITSYVDASTVYGSKPAQQAALRAPDGTLLTSFTTLYPKGLLPLASTSKGCSPLPGKGGPERLVDVPCFLAGDGRVNEHVTLTAVHTIFHREHNRVAAVLRGLNPGWSADKLFEETKKIVTGEMQRIAYNEYFPLVFGSAMQRDLGDYNGTHSYNPDFDASTSNAAATAAFRFGHGQIHPFVHRLDKDFNEIDQKPMFIVDTFFAPYRIFEAGGIDPFLRGLFHSVGKDLRPDGLLAEVVIERLWEQTEEVALDLGAVNLQRGRDHGLASFVEYRRFCHLSEPKDWVQLETVMSKMNVMKLKELYADVGDIDLWIGGMLEPQSGDALIGETFLCIMMDAAKRWRDGDRFWYERDGIFTPDRLTEVRKSTLARILCDNGDDIDRVPVNPFRLTPLTEMTSCEKIPSMNLTLWKEN